MTFVIKNINAFELTRQIFKITSGQSSDINFNRKPINYDEAQIAVIEEAVYIGSSVLDTPIFETIAIKHPITGEMIYFEDAPLIEVSLRKNIVQSKVNKRPGTVKEYINRDDYEIGIRGLLCNHAGEGLPHEKMEELDDILEADQALEVESQLLNALGIYNVVIKDYKFIPNQDYTNVIPYNIRAISDEPIELDLGKPDRKHFPRFEAG